MHQFREDPRNSIREQGTRNREQGKHRILEDNEELRTGIATLLPLTPNTSPLTPHTSHLTPTTSHLPSNSNELSRTL
jgi:hypothetical protein